MTNWWQGKQDSIPSRDKHDNTLYLIHYDMTLAISKKVAMSFSSYFSGTKWTPFGEQCDQKFFYFPKVHVFRSNTIETVCKELGKVDVFRSNTIEIVWAGVGKMHVFLSNTIDIVCGSAWESHAFRSNTIETNTVSGKVHVFRSNIIETKTVCARLVQDLGKHKSFGRVVSRMYV